MSTGDVKNVRNAKPYASSFLFVRAYHLLRAFFPIPEKKSVKMSGTQKNKRQIGTNLCINSCFYFAELTLSLRRRDLSGRFLVHICVFYSSYSSHFAFLCTSSKFFRAKMEPDIFLKIYVITMNSHIKNT